MLTEKERAYINFFQTLLADLRKAAPFPFDTSVLSGRNYVGLRQVPGIDSKIAHLAFTFDQLKQRFRVELYIDAKDYNDTKNVFNLLYSRKEKIESALREAVTWEFTSANKSNTRASRIALYRHNTTIMDNPEKLAELRRWAVETMIRLQKVMSLTLIIL